MLANRQSAASLEARRPRWRGRPSGAALRGVAPEGRLYDERGSLVTKIEAIIRPERLDDVKTALDEIGITGLTVIEVRGSGKQRGYVHRYRGAEYRVNLLDKVRIEAVVSEQELATAVGAVGNAARHGEV